MKYWKFFLWTNRNGIFRFLGNTWWRKTHEKNTSNENTKAPISLKKVWQFIGVVNYYHDMWARHYMLATLTKITLSKVKFKWTKIKQDAFNETDRIVARDTLLTCPGFNEEFNIHTNARNFQLWAVISQKVKPIAFYSRKITDELIRYTLTYRDILSIVETLK